MANRNKPNPGNQPNQTGSQSGNPRNQDLQRGQQQGTHAAQSVRTSSGNKEKPNRRDNASK
jgi:hypothetical protein